MIKIPDLPVNALMKAAGGQSAPFQNRLLPTIPPALLNAPTGTLVNAVVASSVQGGNTVLKTPSGLLTIQTPIPLQQGDALDFQILNPGKDLQLLLLAINAQPVKKESKAPAPQENKGGQSAQDENSFKNITEDEFLFAVTAKSRQQPQSQTQQQAHTPEAPAVKTDTPSFQRGQALLTTLVNVHENVADKLLKLFTFDPLTEKLIPNTPNQTSTNTNTNTPAPTTIMKPGTGVSFRVLEVVLPQVTPTPQQTTTSSASTTTPTISTTETAPAAGRITTSNATPNQQPINTAITTPNTTQTIPTPQNTPPAPGGVSPSPSPSPSPSTPIPTQTVTNTATTQVPTPQAASTPATPQQSVNTQVHVTSTVNTTSPQIPPQTVTLNNNNIPTITAVVVGTEKSGDTILSTPFGTVKFTLDTPLPKNTVLSLEVTALIPPPVQNLTTSLPVSQATADGLPQLMKYWAALDESVKIVRQNYPASANSLLDILPTPDKDLGTKIAKFIHALQTGNISEWLGQTFIRTLQQEKKTETLTQLNKDFSVLRQAFTESPSTQWQPLTFPLFSEGAIHQVRMFIRSMHDEEKQQKNKHGHAADARFVVEIDLEKLGPMQFDGLVKHTDNNKFFDLIIRSKQPLSKEIADDITGIFMTVQEVTGLEGRVSFENTTRFPVNPSQDILNPKTEGSSGSSIVV